MAQLKILTPSDVIWHNRWGGRGTPILLASSSTLTSNDVREEGVVGQIDNSIECN